MIEYATKRWKCGCGAIHDVEGRKCPACKDVASIPVKNLGKAKHLEDTDVTKLNSDLDSEPAQKVKEKVIVRVPLEDGTTEIQKKIIERDETAEERSARLAFQKSAVVAAGPEEIAALRAKYEDK